MASSMMMEKLLNDAKQLTVRLKERDEMADKLISTTMNIQCKLCSMKQYQNEVDELNKTARHRPKILLIQQLAKENAKIRDLQHENTELKQSLEEHQSTLGVIMNKYREQVENLNTTQQLEETFVRNNDNYSEDLEKKEEKLKEMASVMMMASEHWETNSKDRNEEQRLINLLQDKNKIIREVLFSQPQTVETMKENQNEQVLQLSVQTESIEDNYVTPKQSPRLSSEIKDTPEPRKRTSIYQHNHFNNSGSDSESENDTRSHAELVTYNS
ncbi:hypothetical protein HELRODRAFT_188088 [Helobdella robusta]|uniref:FGFR1 oncogene partner 2 homolog n=1 Tax=Helobdella robusta TaxID=6412 RepID=T1FPM0_HELRO|nr:hypothetical protein HELRODRAFT_188088 [Helobdella robusta]ESO13052.1 hypothetical protein HELRODRAFT_188088 [Helobdella robusta]